MLNLRRLARRNTKSLLPTNRCFSLITSPILDGISASPSVLTKLTNPERKMLLWLTDIFSSSSPSFYVRENSNGLGCSWIVFCFFAPLLLSYRTVEGDAVQSRSGWLKREHNPVVLLLCNMDRARSTALETLLARSTEIIYSGDTPCMTESVMFSSELELLPAKTYGGRSSG